MTKNEMKIGVATSDKYDLKTAFSDYNFGYAYYTVG
jgi:E3 ubiquitin-protein ligase NRDP1